VCTSVLSLIRLTASVGTIQVTILYCSRPIHRIYPTSVARTRRFPDRQRQTYCLSERGRCCQRRMALIRVTQTFSETDDVWELKLNYQLNWNHVIPPKSTTFVSNNRLPVCVINQRNGFSNPHLRKCSWIWSFSCSACAADLLMLSFCLFVLFLFVFL